LTIRRDILVIGGGIAGISAAAEMSLDANVAVLETEDVIGYHASGRSAAIFLRNYGNTTLRALNVVAEPILKEPVGISDSSLLSPRGELLIATEAELSALDDYLDGAQGMERITPDEAVDLVPILRRDYIAAAAVERDAQDIDVDRMLQGYARLLRNRNGKIYKSTPAQRISYARGHWTVETPSETFQAPIIVNAAGAWADLIAHMANVRKVGLTPMRRSGILLPAPTGFDINQWPLFVSASEQWYAKPEAGKLFVSPADEDPVEPHDAWPEDMVLAEGLARYQQAVTVPVTRVEKSWAGLRSFVPDRTPVVGFEPRAEGFFWLAGQGGYGMQTAPALAALSADLCMGRTPSLNRNIIAALSPGRFS
jgi:D-arginine dehydrogenase